MSARLPGEAHVAVDVRLAKAAGHRTYIRNLIPRIARLAPGWRWSLIGDETFLRKEAWTSGLNARLVHCGAPVYGIREQFALPQLVPRDADLFWATHYNVPLAVRAPLLLTVHDVAHLRLPEYTRRFARHMYARLMFSAALWRAAAIVCDSEFTRGELLALTGESRAAPQVVHLGVDDEWFEPDVAMQSPVEPPYFVFLGSLKPHKNLAVLVEAFRRVMPEVPERLVIVGKTENLRTRDERVVGEVRSLGARAVMAGELPDDQLRALVRGATALVQPSLYEGFGFPPLEAMAAECPAIVSRSGSLPEVCGDAALYFDAPDAGQLSDALRSVSADQALRSSLKERGREHARRFSWNASAEGTFRLLQGVLGGTTAESAPGRA